jgi:dienelactone hydrolase
MKIILLFNKIIVLQNIILILILILLPFLIFSQKNNLDYFSYRNWPSIKNEKISSNGNYTCFSINYPDKPPYLVVKAITNKWKKEILGDCDFYFSKSGDLLIFKNNHDSLGIIRLGKEEIIWVKNVSSFRVSEESDCFLYRKKDSSNSIVLHNTLNQKVIECATVVDFLFSNNGNVLLMLQKSDNETEESLVWMEIDNFNSKLIYKGYDIKNIKFDASCTKLMFTDKGNSDTLLRLIYYESLSGEIMQVANKTVNDLKAVHISSMEGQFNSKGDKFFFYVEAREAEPAKAKDNFSRIQYADVWSYWDNVLGSGKLNSTGNSKNLLSVIDLKHPDKILILQQKSDDYIYLPEDVDQQYCLAIENVYRQEGRSKSIKTINAYIINCFDGTRKTIVKDFNGYAHLSVRHKYVILYNKAEDSWLSYNVRDGKTINMTKFCRVPFNYERDNGDYAEPQGILGWLNGDSTLLVHDRYDIWQLDPEGKLKPLNVTNGYGRNNKIRLRYLDFHENYLDQFNSDDTLLLSAFNIESKENGFFNLVIGKNKKMEKLIMDSTTFYFPYRYLGPAIGNVCDPFVPLKAKRSHSYVLREMSDRRFPNLFFTKNFKEYTQLTDFEPQLDYNWYTSELICWKLPSGKLSKGILYKPENFNASKKYPIIFFYYERHSDAKNLYIYPGLCTGSINIPWFVSNGYLVFIPDIYSFKTGDPGQHVYNSITSAVSYLSKKPWVNTKKMGLNGHSFGGWETNYIITRTKLFCAASSSSGNVNIVSDYGQPFNGESRHYYYEKSQGKMGATLWQKPMMYVKNSPIFYADRVSTPLLLMHNKEDKVVHWTQAFEWFTALKSLGKKVWMLQYKNEGHVLEDDSNKLDFTIRLGQFFDYYLKDTDPPVWMVKINHLDAAINFNTSLFFPSL